MLRKKPAGALLSKTAHQVEREYQMLRALQTHNDTTSDKDKRVPIPRPYVLCEDESVIGTPFYVMEFLEGRIFTDQRLLTLEPHERREWSVTLHVLFPTFAHRSSLHSWMSAIRSLALLHSLKPDDVGLAAFASRKPYFPRQIRSLSQVSVVQSKAVDVDTKEPTGAPHSRKGPRNGWLNSRQGRSLTSVTWSHGIRPTRQMRRRLVHASYTVTTRSTTSSSIPRSRG